MYDINLSNVKKGENIYYTFLVVGIIFFIILMMVSTSITNKKNKLDKEVLSKRVEIQKHYDEDNETMYSPTYYYIVNGKEYRCESTSSSSNYPSTRNRKVYYNSKNPSECMTEYSEESNKFIWLFFIVPIIFILVAIINIIKISKRLKVITELNRVGKLVKNIPYRMEDTGVVVNNIPIQRPVVDYQLNNGTIITLYGDPRNDRKYYDSDNMVDLVIDENNLDNYFIDFEINRLTGNLKEDYYQYNNQNNYDDYYNQNNNLKY